MVLNAFTTSPLPVHALIASAAERLAVPLDDLGAIEALMDEIELRVEFEGGMNRIFLGDEDVSRLIRSEHISQQASAISAQPSVRLKMVELQRKIASGGGFILDGRDIGSYVFPDADFNTSLSPVLFKLGNDVTPNTLPNNE